MHATNSILVTEEDRATRKFLADQLTADGYRVLAADSRSAALTVLHEANPHLVICDLNGQTLELLDAVRSADGVAARIDPDTPLIVLSSDADELARVRYLARGGDDVVLKPFSYVELRERIEAILRCTYRRRSRRELRVGRLHIDTSARQVTFDGEVVSLTQTEFALLQHLALAPARVFTKAELLRDVWGYPDRCRTRTVDAHACRIRTKLRGVGAGEYLRAVWGVGYQLEAPS